MKHLFSSLLIYITPFVLIAQNLDDSSTLLPEHIFQKNYFELGFGNSGNYLEYTPKLGSIVPESVLNPNPYLKGTYHFNINPRNEISTSLSVNFPKISFKIPHISHQGGYYYTSDKVTPLPSIVPSISYSNRLVFKSSRSFFEWSVGSGFYYNITPFEGLISMQTENNQTIALIAYYIDKGVKPFFNSSLGYNYLLKNGHFLRLSLGYNYFLKDLLYGEYYLHNGTSSGTFRNKGNSVFVGLSYNFSNTIRNSDLLPYSKMINPKEKKKFDEAYKINRRYINSNDVFLSSNFGLAFATNVPSNQDIYDKASLPRPVFNLSIEKGIKNYFFAEVSYVGYEYYDAMKLKNIPITEGGNAFYSHQLLLGVNKKMVNLKNNKNYINFHAGFGVAYTSREKGLSGELYSSMTISNSTFSDTITQISKYYQLKQLFPLAYMGISKDFLLGKGFYFNVLYRYNQGFINVYEQQLMHYSNQYPNGTTLKITMNGSYHTFQLGFKYRIKHFSE